MRKYILFGKKAEYQTMSWWSNFASGHISLFNHKLTIYGANAINWAVNIKTKKYGYVCFTLPSISRFRSKEGFYFYCSPDATPSSSTFYIGKDKNEVVESRLRRIKLGHNFKSLDNT